MKYFEVEFIINAPKSIFNDSRDILSALAGEVGFETFEETSLGLKGYVQQQLFNKDSLNEQIELFPFEDVTIEYTVHEADDKDWNEQWEQHGFQPIIVDGLHPIIIHDGRHLPVSDSYKRLYPTPILIEIDAHLAFGTGTHETTRMMVANLQKLDLSGCRVLDCGCGTGILSIASLKLGAKECVGYDIDEWSTENARHNAVINSVDSLYEIHLGDVSVLKRIDKKFDVVMANINRNILLKDMSEFAKMMNINSNLLLSGFYQQDVPQLIETAKSLNLKVVGKQNDGDWACLHFVMEAY